MNKLITSLIILVTVANANFAQVGINTEIPQAMLDVNGDAVIQGPAILESALTVEGETILEAPLKLNYIHSETVTELTGDEIVLISDLNDQNIVKEVSLETLATGLNVPNENTPNTSIYAAKKTSSFTLLGLGLLVSGFRTIDFTSTNRIFGNPSLFSDSNHSYTVPSNGVYEISFDFKMGPGLQASLLSGNPGIGIVRTRGAENILLDSKSFSGLGGLVNLTITDTKINFIYSLQAGDRITFGTTNASVITLTLLANSSASFHIRKIAGPPQ